MRPGAVVTGPRISALLGAALLCLLLFYGWRGLAAGIALFATLVAFESLWGDDE